NEVRTPLKIRRRKPAARPQKRFPGEASWHWHVQLAIERIIAPLRIGVLAITYVAWLLSSHPAVAVPALARVLIIVAILYALADMLLLYRAPHVVSKRPWVPTVVDLVFIVLWIYATGGA